MDVTPASGTVGAYVRGVDLRSVTPAQQADIVQSWHRHGVLFFRDQHLDVEEQLAAARIFGDPEFFAFAPAVDEAQPLVHRIDQAAGRRSRGVAIWHTDATWMEQPPRGSMLQATSLPPTGGDTLFASAAAAYENLSGPVQRLVDGLTAAHHGGPNLAIAAAPLGIEVPEEPVSHPVVRVHPDTGQRGLFVNPLFTQKIDEVTQRESQQLLPLLYETFKDPGVQCRFTWEPGDVAIWDNRAVQHYASPDYDDERLMRRVVLAGDPVTGI